MSSDSARLRFGLLGPIEVEGEHGTLPVGGPRQRALLALLLLHANTVVSRPRLIDALWGERPPETAANALQVAVHGLRKLLGAERITTHAAGYLLRVEPDELDLERFERLVELARTQAPDPAASSTRRGTRAVARRPARGPRRRPVRDSGRSAAGGGTTGGARTPNRAGSGGRQARRARPRARAARRELSAAGTARVPAGDSALPVGAAGGRARRPAARAPSPRRRARDRAGAGAATARAGDSDPRSGARRAPGEGERDARNAPGFADPARRPPARARRRHGTASPSRCASAHPDRAGWDRKDATRARSCLEART